MTPKDLKISILNFRKKVLNFDQGQGIYSAFIDTEDKPVAKWSKITNGVT
jgi:hypothetical protein